MEEIKNSGQTLAPSNEGGRPLVIPDRLDGTWVLQYLAPSGISPHLVSFSYDPDGTLIVEYVSHHSQGVNFTMKQTASFAKYSDGKLCFRVMCGGPGNELFEYHMDYYRGDVMLGWAQRVDTDIPGFHSPLYAKFIHE